MSTHNNYKYRSEPSSSSNRAYWPASGETEKKKKAVLFSSSLDKTDYSVSDPRRVSTEKLRKNSSTVHRVGEFLSIFKPDGEEASKTKKFGPLSSGYWKQTPKGGYDNNYRELTKKEPSIINTGGWVRPNHALWSSPPDLLSNETSEGDGKTGSRFTYPVSTWQKRDNRSIDTKYGAVNWK